MTDTILPEAIEIQPGRLTTESLKARLGWIVEYINLNGWAPTHREIGPGWGVSAAAVRNSLEHMQDRGWIIFGGQARQIWITEAGEAICRGDGNGSAAG